MKRILAMLIMVVLALPLASARGESGDARKMGNTVNGKGKEAQRGTLSIGPSTKTHDGDEDGFDKEKDDDSTVISGVT